MKHFILLFLSVFIFQVQVGSSQFSLYQDYKARKIGDLVTIVLQENITGSSSADNSNKSGVNGGATGSVTGNLAPFLPLFGANAAVDYQSNDRNAAAQSNLLRGTVSARIEEILPNGDLYLVGMRSNEVNGELYKLEIKGYIRTNDIDSYNVVASYKIANAEIVYVKKESSEKLADRSQFWQKVIWVTIGIGLGVAAYVGVF